MVEKMHFVNIAGPIKILDTFVIQNVVPHEIQLINAYNILDSVKGIYRFDDDNPYQGLVEKVKKLGEVADITFEYDENAPVTIMPTVLIEPEIDGYERQLETIQHISNSLKEDLDHKLTLKKQIQPIENLEIEIQKFFDFDYMKFRFGKMPTDSFEKLFDYIEEMDCIVFEISREGDDVFLIYFTPRSQQGNIDSLFASIYFERIRISSDINGYPKEALKQLNEEIEELTKRIKELDDQCRSYVENNIKRLDELYTFVVQLDSVFDVRNLAVRSKEAFYLTGWISDSQLKEFKEEVDKIPHVTCIVEEDDAIRMSKPPTKLKNPKFFKPFESLVSMYGTPSYDEYDPTIFIAITYILLFGAMFGDVGQGLIIALFGFLLYKYKGVTIAKMGIYLGASSVVFGFVYGSVFGYEDFLGELLNYKPIHTMDVMLELIVVAIVVGVVLILIAMVISIKNSYDQENIGKLLFDRNGVAGLVFYLTVLGIVLATVLNISVSPIVIVLFIILPLIIIFMAHPLGNYVNKKSHIFPTDKGGFFIEAFFELIETVLAFLSNTISFMRIGAFALNHVGFFLAFHKLSEMVSESAGTAGGIAVMVLGNIVIIFLEGLIVGIQGMRLAYYELFSRFYDGNGTEFKPFSVRKSENDIL